MACTIDDVLNRCGGVGRFQVSILVMVGLLVSSSVFFMYMTMFVLTIPPHRCAMTNYPNDTYTVQSPHHYETIQASIPWDDELDSYSSCHIYSSNITENGTRKQVECAKYVYDTSVFVNSFIEQFDFVCDRTQWRSMANSALMAGNMVGFAVQGYFCDLFGRRKFILTVFLVNVVVGISNAFPVNIPSFLVARFMTGVSSSMAYGSAFVTGLEFMRTQQRRGYSVYLGTIWFVAASLLVLVAYFIKDSQHLILTLTVPQVLFFVYYWQLPESPRWLLSKGRYKQAGEVLRKIASTNGKEFPEELFNEVVDQQVLCPSKETAILDKNASNGVEVIKPKGESLIRMLSYKLMALQFFVTTYQWIVNSTTYYVLMFNMSNLSGSIHLNVFLLNCVDLAGTFLTLPMLDRFGRQKTYRAFLSVAILGCILYLIPAYIGGPKSATAITALSLVGRAGISSTYNVIYLISAELFPTSVRTRSMGSFAMAARIGSLFSPYMADFGILLGGPFKDMLTMILCSVIAVLAFCLSLVLPETTKRRLPNTIAEVLEANNIKEKGQEALLSHRKNSHETKL